MQCIGIKSDVFRPAAINAPGNLIGTPEVPFEHQLTTACDQNGVHVGSARESLGHSAQRVAVDELIIIDGGDGPAVVSRDRETAAVGRIRVHRQRRERRQRSSPEKLNKLAPSHAILSRSHVLRAPNVSDDLANGIADAETSLTKVNNGSDEPSASASRKARGDELGSGLGLGRAKIHTPKVKKGQPVAGVKRPSGKKVPGADSVAGP